MLNTKLIYFCLLTVHCAYGAVSTLQPPTIIRTLNSTDVGPEFVSLNETSTSTNIPPVVTVQNSTTNSDKKENEENEGESQRPVEGKFHINIDFIIRQQMHTEFIRN